MFAAMVALGVAAAADAMISEPDVVITGKLASGESGTLVTITLNGAATPLKSFTVGADLKYLLRVPMDAYGTRVAGTARTGDAAVIAIGQAMAARLVIPARGTLVKMDLVKRDGGQWAKDHPGDDGSGDMNRNGVSDLQDFLNGNDPAGCIWTATDATHAETTVFHPQVLANCLADAGKDLKHNLIRIARGTYAGTFSYTPVVGEEYDLTLLGGFDPKGKPERFADPAGTILDADTDGDGTGNGVGLTIDTDTGKTGGKVHVESLAIRNGLGATGQSGGGVRARIYKGDLELVGNIVSGNSADLGGGIFVAATDSAAIFLANNLIYGNSGTNAAALRITAAKAPVTLINNTIVDNIATASGNGRTLLIETSTAPVELTNNIVNGNSPPTMSEIFVNSSGQTIPLTVSHNAFAAGNGLYADSPGVVPLATVSSDPQFKAPAGGNYLLAQGSPCIDQGIAQARLPATDIIGTARIVGSAVDLGAFEFTGLSTKATVTLTNLNQIYDGTARVATATTTPTGLKVDFTYDGSADAPLSIGSYAVVATINDPNYNGVVSGTLVIGKGVQMISFSPLAVRQLGGGDIAPGATASSGLEVGYSSSNPAVATITAGKIHLVGVGSTIITAHQGGNANFGAAVDISRTLSVVATTSGPALALSALSHHATTTRPVMNVSGTVSALNGVQSVTVNGYPVTVAADGSFSCPVNLVAGSNDIVVLATDNLGLTCSATRSITLDASAPLLTVTKPMDNSASSTATVELAGKVGDEHTTVSYSLNGGSLRTASITGTDFKANVTVELGMNTIEIVATDNFGKSSRVKRTVVFNPALSLAVDTPPSDIKTGSSKFLLKGSVGNNTTPVVVRIAVDGKSFTPTVTDGTFEQELPLESENSYPVTVTATDQNNNVVTVQRNLTRVWFGDSTGKSNGTGTVTIADAIVALRSVLEDQAVPQSTRLRLDVAPLDEGGKPSGDGTLDIADVIMLLRRIVAADAW